MEADRKTVKLFVASSIIEFEKEREKLKSKLGELNQYDGAGAVRFEPQFCEALSGSLSQAELNQKAAESQFVYVLVGRKLGDATKEEFEAAYRQKENSGRAKLPRIHVFFQDVPEDETAPEVMAFRKRLKRLHVYHRMFTNWETVLIDIIFELNRSGVFAGAPVYAEAEGKALRDEVLARMQENRRTALELAQTGVIMDNLPEIIARYEENIRLTDKYHLEPGTRSDYAVFLHKQGEHAKALEIGGELDARYDDHDDPDDRAALKLLLGDCHAAQNDPEAAEPYYRAALDLYRDLASEEPEDYAPDAAEACSSLAGVLVNTFRFNGAERLYREALKYYLSCPDDAPAKYVRELAQICHALRGLLEQQNRHFVVNILAVAEQAFLDAEIQGVFERVPVELDNIRFWLEQFPCPDLAEQSIHAAETVARDFMRDNNVDYEQAMAIICLNMGRDLREHNRMEEAETLLRKAVEIERRLSEQDPALHEYNVADSLAELAGILGDTNRPHESEAHYREALEIMRRLAEQNPDKYVLLLSLVYHNLAVLLAEYEHYEQAVSVSHKALELFLGFAERYPGVFDREALLFCNTCAILSERIERPDMAEAMYRDALEAARRQAEQNPDEYEPILALSCNNLGAFLRQHGRPDEAEPLYLEALEIYRKLSDRNPAAYEPDLARMSFNLGLVELSDKGNRAAAKAYFEQARDLYKNYSHYAKELNDTHEMLAKCLT